VLPVLAALPLALAPAQADFEIPKNDGWVTDLAGLLEPGEERALETLMESYKQGSGHEVALLTIETLPVPIERYALEVARAWGIGKEGEHDGALLVVSRGDRALRIEVGRGLEGTLTDSISGRIIRDVIAPRFKQGRFHEGLRAGIEAIHAAAGGDYAALENARRRAPEAVGGGACMIFSLLLIIFLLFSRGRGGKGRRGGLPWWLLLAAASSSGRSRGWSSSPRGGGFGGGGFGGFGGGGGFSGGGASGGW
jgi:uncharacterized protein